MKTTWDGVERRLHSLEADLHEMCDDLRAQVDASAEEIACLREEIDAVSAASVSAWLEAQRRAGVNILEDFVVRWDAAERRLVVNQHATPMLGFESAFEDDLEQARRLT